MHELAMLPFFGSISDVTWHFFSPVQWLKSGGWAENTWGYRLTSNSNTALPRPTKPDSLYLDLPTKSSQFGTCRPTSRESNHLTGRDWDIFLQPFHLLWLWEA